MHRRSDPQHMGKSSQNLLKAQMHQQSKFKNLNDDTLKTGLNLFDNKTHKDQNQTKLPILSLVSEKMEDNRRKSKFEAL